MKYVKHYMYFLAAIMLQSLNMVAADDEVIENYDIELEVGIIYVSEDSFKSGEYTGLEEEGFHGNINFSIISPSAYDSDDEKKIFYEVTGTNLGLDSRSVFARNYSACFRVSRTRDASCAQQEPENHITSGDQQ